MDPLSILLLFALTILFFLKMGSFWERSAQNLPPGPRPLPLIGNLHIMDLKRPHRTMLKLSKQYGPVLSIQMGLQKMVVLTGYETVKEALVNQAEAFAERPIVPIFEESSRSYGVIFSHGENWKVMRRFTLTTLRDYGMGKRSIEDRIVEECGFLIKEIESYEGKPFETTTIMNAAVANIIVSILLAKRYEYEDATFVRLLKLVNENIRLLGSPSVTLYNMFPALGFLFGGRKTVLKNQQEMHAFINATFIEHLKNLDENDQRSFIDSFLIRQQEVMVSFQYATMYKVHLMSFKHVSDKPSFGMNSLTNWQGFPNTQQLLMYCRNCFEQAKVVHISTTILCNVTMNKQICK